MILQTRFYRRLTETTYENYCFQKVRINRVVVIFNGGVFYPQYYFNLNFFVVDRVPSGLFFPDVHGSKDAESGVNSLQSAHVFIFSIFF